MFRCNTHYSKLFIKFALLSFLALAFTGSISLLHSSSANAASQYDNIVQTSNTLSVFNGTSGLTCSPIDVSGQPGSDPQYGWAVRLKDITKWNNALVGAGYPQLYIDAFNSALDNSTGWAVNQLSVSDYDSTEQWQFGTGHGGKMIQILFNPSPDATVIFHQTLSGNTTGGINYATIRSPSGGTTYSVIISQDNSCGVNVGLASYDGIGNSLTSPNFDYYNFNLRNLLAKPDNVYSNNVIYDIKNYFINFPIQYPDGYNGPLFETQAPTPPTQPGKYKPNTRLTNRSQNEFAIHVTDDNFNTIDPVPFTCNDGTTPTERYELSQYNDETNDLIRLDSGQYNPTVTYDHTMPTGNHSYAFVSWYDCGANNGDGLDLSESNVFQFDFNSSSVVQSPDLHIVSLASFHIVIQDTKFNTIDPNVFTCQDGTAPIIHYQLFSQGTLLDSGVMSPTVQYQHDLPQNPQTGSFTAYYDCGGFTNTGNLDFSSTSVLDYEVNPYGGQNVTCADTSISDVYCKLGQSFNIGIFGTTFNGLVSVITSLSSIDASTCNTNWATILPNQYLHLQSMPQSVCSRTAALYSLQGSPFYSFKIMLNVIASGAAVMLLVYGVLRLIGVRILLPGGAMSQDEQPAPAGRLSGQGEGFGHNRTYVKGGK